jgi:predicted metal-dependent HD superfamily phosphohydrolase
LTGGPASPTLAAMAELEARDPLAELLARQQPLALSPALGAELATAYATPPRAYHHLGHVVEVMAWFDWVGQPAHGQSWGQPREVATAILFHDAIYVAGARDNEARSAARARQAVATHAELAGVQAERVAQLIELTARHGHLERDALDGEARLFLDCDLAILAAPPARYQRYCAEIAEEYRAVPAAAYRAGRRAFVAQLRARPRLFLSELFHDVMEDAARRNLAAEAASLG